jgi:hypothetical protein
MRVGCLLLVVASLAGCLLDCAIQLVVYLDDERPRLFCLFLFGRHLFLVDGLQGLNGGQMLILKLYKLSVLRLQFCVTLLLGLVVSLPKALKVVLQVGAFFICILVGLAVLVYHRLIVQLLRDWCGIFLSKLFMALLLAQ